MNKTWLILAIFFGMVAEGVVCTAEAERPDSLENTMRSLLASVVIGPTGMEVTARAEEGEHAVELDALLEEMQALLAEQYGTEGVAGYSVNAGDTQVSYWTAEEENLLYLLGVSGEDDDTVTLFLKKEAFPSLDPLAWDDAARPFGLEMGDFESRLVEALESLPYIRTEDSTDRSCYTIPLVTTEDCDYVQLWTESLQYLQSMINGEVDAVEIPYERELFRVKYFLNDHILETMDYETIVESLSTEYGTYIQGNSPESLQVSYDSSLGLNELPEGEYPVVESEFFQNLRNETFFAELASIRFCHSYENRMENSMWIEYDTQKLNALKALNAWSVK